MSLQISPPNKFKITPLTPTDLPTLAKFIFHSQLTQPTNRFLFENWPNEDAQVALYLSALENSIHDPEQEFLKVVVVDDDDGSKEMIGSLVLVRKGKRVVEEEEVSVLGEGDGEKEKEKEKKTPDENLMNAEFFTAMKDMLAKVLKSMEGVDHLVLSSIFITPAYRNKSLGSRLVKLAVQRATDAGLPLFLASVPSACGFYRKLGFVDTVAAEVDLRDWGGKFGGYGVYRLQGMVARP